MIANVAYVGDVFMPNNWKRWVLKRCCVR